MGGSPTQHLQSRVEADSGRIYVVCPVQDDSRCRSTACILAERCQRRWPIMHKRCGQVAFYARRRPQPDERINPEDYVLLDGSQPEAGTPFRCGSCGALIVTGDDGEFPMTVGLT